MTRLARVTEAMAVLVALGVALVLVTGGGRVAGVPVTRAEDLLVLFAGLVALRALLAPIRLPAIRPAWAVGAGVGAYAVLMSFIVVTRHAALRTHALDLGYYVQVVWSIGRGHGAYVTLPPMHAWGDHFSPVLYVFVPLAWLLPVAPVLLAGQALLLGLGGVVLFRYAARRLGEQAGRERLAAGVAALYLLNPSLHGINLRDIHPQAFAIPLVIAAALAFDARRWGWCAAALVLTLMTREDAAIAVVGFGLWLALARGRVMLGGAVALASVLVLAADVTWIMPYFRGAPYPHLQRWTYLGSSLGEILANAALRPWRWLAVGLAPAKLLYLVKLLAPLGFLPLLAPRALLAVAPALAMNLLSVDPILVNHRSQYQAFVLPFLFLAAVDGCATARSLGGARPRGRRLTAGGLLTAGALASVALTARTFNDFTVTRWRLGPDQRAAYALMARVPPDASVSANDRIVPRLATRREIYLAPTNVGRSEYVLERVSESPVPPEGYRLVARAEGWVLYRR